MFNSTNIIRFLIYITLLLVSTLFFIPNLKSQTQYQTIDSLLAKAFVLGSENYIEARILSDSARELSIELDYAKGEAEALRLNGLTQFYGIQYAKALPLFIESYNLFKSIGDTAGMIKAKNNIAITYSYQGLIEKSLEILRENLAMIENTEFHNEIAKTLNNIAVDLKNLGQLSQALKYYFKALEIAERNNLISSLGNYYNNVGNIYIDMNKLDSALYFYQKSLLIRLEIKDKQGIKNTYQGLGQYYIKTKNYKKAIEYFEMSMAIANEIGIVYEIASAAKDLSVTYSKLGNYEKAYKNQVLYTQMNDSLKSVETVQLITRIELESAFEKEREIQRLAKEKTEAENRLTQLRNKGFRNILLSAIIVLIVLIALVYRNYLLKRNHNTDLTIRNDEILLQKEEIMAQRNSIETQKEHLQELNHTKDKFFSIIAHDLINPLNGMMGLTNNMIGSIKQHGDKDLLSSFMLLRQTAWRTFSLLQNLLEWAQTQTGRIAFNPTPASLNEIIDSNIELHKLKLNEKKLNLHFKRNGNTNVFVDPNMLNTIVRNLISNAIKFTPENGKIYIHYSDCEKSKDIAGCEENFVLLSIKDTGVGIDKEIIDKLFKFDIGYTTYGTNNEKGTGLGLALTKEFVEMNSGKIWVESELGSGTTFKITLPKS
jgi:signal transduction histidine kinase